MDKKQKIAEFIESIVDGDVDSNAILMGGAVKEPDGLNYTKNNDDCKNDNYDSCHKSTNRGRCQNVSGMCNSSSNGSGCDNTIHPVNYSQGACSNSACG